MTQPAPSADLSTRQTLATFAIAGCLYAGFFALLFLPAWTSGLLAPADGIDNYYPSLIADDKSWTQHLFCGYPTFADPQELRWYPLAWLFLGIFGSWNAFIISGYVVAAIGAHAVVWRESRWHAGGVVAAVCFAAGGFLIGHLRHATVLHTAAWLPWLLLALRTLHAASPESRSDSEPTIAPIARCVAGIAAVTATLILGGHPQVQFYTLIVAACLVLFTATTARCGALRFLVGSAVGVTLGLGVSAIQWIPTLELAAEGVRQEITLEEFGSFALPVEQATTLVAPFGYGNPLQGYQGKWSFEELAGYAGLLPLLTVVAFGWRRRRDPFFWFLTATAIVGVALALGNATLGSLLHKTPGFDRFRAPARHLLEWNACIALAAGLALAQLRTCSISDRIAALRGSLIATGIVIGGALVISAVQAPATLLWSVLLPAFVFALHAVVLYWWATDPERTRTVALLAVAIVDLTSFAYFCEWRRVVPAAAAEPPQVITALQDRLAATHQRYTPLLGTRQGNEAGTPNRTRLWQVESTSGFNPLRLRHYAELTGIDLAGVVQPAILRDENRTLDILASRFVIVPNALAPRVAASARFVEDRNLSAGLVNNVVFENVEALPRAWIAHEAVVVPGEELVATIYSSRLPNGEKFLPRRQALLDESLPQRLGPVDRNATVTIVDESSTTMQLQTQSESVGLLVTSDAYYPGWEVTIDGAPAETQRAYHALRSVVVPAGTHTVEFRFHPNSERTGQIVALVALLLVLGLAVVGGRRSRSS